MFKTVALVLFISVQTALACEAELSLHSLTQVIFAAVDQGFVPAEKIQRWVSRQGQGNPLDGIALKGKGLSYRQGIQNLLDGVSSQVLAQIQAQLEERDQQNNQKERARENSRPILHPTKKTDWGAGRFWAWSPAEAGPPMLAVVNWERQIEIRRPFEKNARTHLFPHQFAVGYTPILTWGIDGAGKWKLWVVDKLNKQVLVGDLSSSELQPVAIPDLQTGQIPVGWIDITGSSPLLIVNRACSIATEYFTYSLSPHIKTVFETEGDWAENDCWLLDKKNQLLVFNKTPLMGQITNTSVSGKSTEEPLKFPVADSAKALKLLQTKSGRVLAIFQRDEDKVVILAPFENSFRHIKIAVGAKIWGEPEVLQMDERLIMAIPFTYDNERGQTVFGIAAYEPLVSSEPIWKIENLRDPATRLKMWIGELGSLFLATSVGEDKFLIAEPLVNLTYPIFKIEGDVRNWVEHQGQMHFLSINGDGNRDVLYRVMKP